MKKINSFIGVDVSKKKLDIYIINRSSEPEKQFYVVDNNKSGFEYFIGLLSELSISPKQCLFCLEHTGVYAMPFCMWLESKKLSYALESGLQIKQSTGIKRGKTDKVDAKAIAEYAYLHRESIQPHLLPAKVLIILKQFIAYRNRLVESRKAFYVARKELSQFMEPSLIKDVIEDSDSIITDLNQRIRDVDNKITDCINQDRRIKILFDLITSVPGVGTQIAINLIVSTRGFTSFKNARQFASYAGIAPFEYKSGSSIKGRTRVSNLANKKIKSLLNMGALNAIRLDPEMKKYYERKVKEGKNKMLVINAVRNKIIARVFATVNRGTPFVNTSKYAI